MDFQFRQVRATSDPEEIDYFFVIDGDFAYYLIPVAAVGGLTAIRLTAYSQYRLPTAPIDSATRPGPP